MKVESAAILIDGTVHSMLRPARHHDIIRRLAASGMDIPIQGEQGFVLDTGKFVARKAAARIAMKSGQCKDLIAPPNLYSEDLW